jgi:tRNA(fMet)-specific endonuclease VapC
MTKYLIDTNVCIALINGSEVNVRRRLQRTVARRTVILLSSVVAFELWYGVAKSQRKDSNTQRLEAFFAGPLEWTLFDEDDARAAGTVRAELEAIGKPIGAYDVLLAGQARRRGAILLSSNAKEFAHVPGLKWEDWAVPRR